MNSFIRLIRVAAVGLFAGVLSEASSLGTLDSTFHFEVDDAVPLIYSLSNLGGGKVVRSGLFLTGETWAVGGPDTTEFGVWEDSLWWDATAVRGQARIRESVRSDKWRLSADGPVKFYSDYLFEGRLAQGDGETYDPALHRGGAEFSFQIWWQAGGEPVLVMERAWAIGMPQEIWKEGPASFTVDGGGLIWWERTAVLDVKAVPDPSTASLAVLSALWVATCCPRISARQRLRKRPPLLRP